MSTPFDPAAVVAEFIDAVSPYDPDPQAGPVAILGVRTALGEGVFPVSDHVVRAMCRALASYRDPEDRGSCVDCGGRHLDENLHCRECGRLHGILGQVIAEHAARVAAQTGAGAESPGAQWPGAQWPGAQSPGAQSPAAQSPGAQSPGAQHRAAEPRELSGPGGPVDPGEDDS